MAPVYQLNMNNINMTKAWAPGGRAAAPPHPPAPGQKTAVKKMLGCLSAVTPDTYPISGQVSIVIMLPINF
jgi:hypothetical protein